MNKHFVPLAFIALAFIGCDDWQLRTTELELEQEPEQRLDSEQDLDTDTSPIPMPTDRLARQPGANPIVAENQLPGERRWRNGRVAAPGELELFTSTDSGAAGGSIGVRVSANKPTTITAEVFRMGWYGGAGARLIWSGGPFLAEPQAECPVEPETGMVDCPWTDTFSFEVGKDWVSGIYLVKVLTDGEVKRFAPFVVRDSRASELLFQVAFNTYQAYNRWGGASLYVDETRSLPSRRARMVSYNRPYRTGEGAGELLRWEVPLIRFLEQHGYDVTYTSNLDFERYDDVIEGVGAFVHGGHDEYWTANQRDQVERALSTGRMSLAYFGANGGYWRIRMEPDARGAPLRHLVCFKNEPELDPIPNSTIRFRDEPRAHPENSLFGTMYAGYQNIPFPLVVGDPSHWLYAGTGLKKGELLPGLLGYEFDRLFDNGSTPPGTQVVMESPVVNAEGLPDISHVVERTLPNGRIVFSAGSIFWPLAFADDPQWRDSRVQAMSWNALERALSHRRAARPPPSLPLEKPSEPAPIRIPGATVGAVAGVPGPPGHGDGPAQSARFFGPTGLAVGDDGKVVVVETGSNRIRLIDTDAKRTVRTIAGDGTSGHRDGPGAGANFRQPMAAAVARDGSIFVADAGNHVIRRIAPDEARTVSVFVGAARESGDADGDRLNARLYRPSALAIDAQDNLYVASQKGNTIRRVDAQTGKVTTLAGQWTYGSSDAANGRDALFSDPVGLALSGDSLYVLDGGTQRIRRVLLAPPHRVTTIAGDVNQPAGFLDGAGTVARFRSQMGLSGGVNGELFLADAANFRLREIQPGSTAAETQVRTLAGSGLLGVNLGPADHADLSAPTGSVQLPDGRILVSDSYSNVIRVISR